MQRGTYSTVIHALTHLKGQGKVDRQVSRKGVESTDGDRGSWKEENRRMYRRKRRGKESYREEEEKQGNIRPQQLE